MVYLKCASKRSTVQTLALLLHADIEKCGGLYHCLEETILELKFGLSETHTKFEKKSS